MAKKAANKKSTPTKATPSFEEGLTEIEKRIAELEGGELSLEASIEAYEKAMGALKSCYALLNQAEGKIAMLTKAASNSTLGGEYDVESGSASEDEHELAIDPDGDEDDDETEDDADDSVVDAETRDFFGV